MGNTPSNIIGHLARDGRGLVSFSLSKSKTTFRQMIDIYSISFVYLACTETPLLFWGTRFLPQPLILNQFNAKHRIVHNEIILHV